MFTFTQILDCLNRYIFHFLTALFFVSIQGISQNQYLGISGNYGFLIAHRASMQHLVTGHTQALSIDFAKQFKNKTINQLYNMPQFGFCLYTSNTGNLEKLGNAIGIYPYVDFHFLTKPTFSWDFQLGWGLGYVSNKFDRVNNYKNVAIGSHLNLIFGLRTDIKVALTKTFLLKTGLAFTHFSNGAVKLPNLGLNFPTYHVGINYLLKTKKLNNNPLITETSEDITRKWLVIGYMGFRQVEPTNQRLYANWVLSVERKIIEKPKYLIHVALDGFYKPTLQPRAQLTDLTAKSSNIQVGLFAAYHQKFDPFSIYIGMGLYAIDDFKADGPLYHKLGLRYNVTPNIILNFNIYSHYAKADHFQIGVGYKW